ncbi:MAG: TIGR00375 family protein [Methanothermobacter tenebrarum]
MIINADLHIHSCFSQATSQKMTIKNIAPQAKLKGLDLVGTGDGFHPKWLKMIIEDTEATEDGIYSHDDCDFIITSEVEDLRRVHHLLILPSIETAMELKEKLPSSNINKEGRPKVRMRGSEIMDLVHEYDGLIGPSHAFTPWTSLYKSYDSYKDCYGKAPDFLELGLSADTDMADRIKELHDIPFLTNSDAHSPWPHRLGREFNQFKVDEISFSAIKRSIKGKKIRANYGFDPRLGKYHLTACTRCYKVYKPEEAIKLGMKCSCGGTIKKGVDYRIHEIATWKKPHHPSHRPPYIHIMPLAEIISMKHGKGVTTRYVQRIWGKLVEEFGNEIRALLDAPLDKIREVDGETALAIRAFRNGSLVIIPGGGGRYGEIRFPENTLDAYFR